MNTIVSVSMWKAILGEKPETLNQVHKFWLNEYPAGGEEIKVIPVIIVIKADNPTEPAPIIASIVLGRRFPNIARVKNPAKGKAGIIHKILNMFSTKN